MLTLTLTPIILAALAVLSTVVGVWDKISSRVRNAVILASILILFSLMSQIVQVNEILRQMEINTAQAKIIRDRNVLFNSDLGMIDEASGGATYGNLAYIVDDDDPSIFLLEYLEDESKYWFMNPKGMKIVDARPCVDRLDWDKPCTESTPLELTKADIKDLEGAAIHDSKLYLTTSQTSSTEPQRSLFLELSLDGKIHRATRKLRGAILDLLKNEVHGINVGNKLEDIQVEGLAIDKDRYVYFGFRSPLINGRALVIRANIDQIFSDKPQFESFLLDLERRGERYGITSLDYDRGTNQILVLGNGPVKTKTLPSAIWKWKVGDSESQRPHPYKGDIFTVFDAPGSRPAKPEIILQPTRDRIHLFFDAQGLGGQLSLLRNGSSVFRSDE